MQIELDDSELQHKLEHAAARLANPAEMMQRISVSLMRVVDENFMAQGRPAWAGLKVPRPGGAILHLSGQLASSITPFHTADSAGVSTNKVYAAIHQFGGKTPPHVIRPRNKQALAFGGIVRKSVNHPGSNIPARPYMPMDKNGNLQKEARDEVMDVIDVYAQQSF